jgi:ubiquinone biosynthesis monooxygenase Coq6
VCTASTPIIRDSFRISLLEAGQLSKILEWKPTEGQYSNRVSSITQENLAFLRGTHNRNFKYLHVRVSSLKSVAFLGIGAWKHVDESRTRDIEEMQVCRDLSFYLSMTAILSPCPQVWDGLSGARIHFDSLDMQPMGAGERPSMARLTENLNLQRGLLRALDENGTVELIDGARVNEITRETDLGGWPTVSLSNGRKLRARLLVSPFSGSFSADPLTRDSVLQIGADGFNSPVKAFSHVSSFGWAYDTHAVVASLNIEPPLGNYTAWQRFLPTGPIAFLPVRCVMLLP